MSKKSEITTFFNTTLSVVIIISKIKLVLNKILDNFYSTEVTDDQATGTYTTAVSAVNFPYSIRLMKQGGVVHVYGYFENKSGVIDQNNRIFEFKDTEYMPKEDTGAISSNLAAKGLSMDKSNQNLVMLQIQKISGKTYLQVVGTIPPNDSGQNYSIISLTYNTKE